MSSIVIFSIWHNDTSVWKVTKNRRFKMSLSGYLKIYTDGSRILHTLLVKHYNDLLDRQRSERGKDEVTYFYDMLGTFFVYTLGKSSKLWVLHKNDLIFAYLVIHKLVTNQIYIFSNLGLLFKISQFNGRMLQKPSKYD